MTKSKKSLLALLLFLTAAFAIAEFGKRSHWLENLTDQARLSKTVRYYEKNQGGYDGSAAEWTREAFH